MEGTVRAAYYQYYVYGGGELDPSPETTGGLLDVLDDQALRINCACHTAPVAVTTEALNTAPDRIESGWELAAEADIATTTGQLMVLAWEPTERPPAMGNLAGAGPGRYRLRCYARGRQTAAQHHVLTEPLEHHLLQPWPVTEPHSPRPLNLP